MTPPATSTPRPSADDVHHGYRTVDALGLLAPYPHVARCATCRRYADDALTTFSATVTVCATLAHHESGHRCDTLSTASEYFGIDDDPHTGAASDAPATGSRAMSGNVVGSRQGL